MIERFIDNDLTLKRWRRFKKKKTASVAAVCFIILCAFSFTAEFFANSKPLMLSYKGEIYVPVVKDYHPSVFGRNNELVMSYRSLELGEDDWALWPVIKWDPYESNDDVDSYPSEPSSVNILGTDDRGRDVLTRLLYGFRYSIVYAFLVWLLSTIIGISYGGISGYYGGKIDIFTQRFSEILSTVPQFFLLIILISIFTPNLTLLVIVSCTFGWIPISYYVRAEFLKNRKQEFVEAAKSMGARDFSIIFKHILPNSLAPVITFAPFVISGNITALASLDYLGFGLEIPTPSWGELLKQAQANYTIAWWLALYPALALFVTLTLLNLVGEGVRDAMDPKLD